MRLESLKLVEAPPQVYGGTPPAFRETVCPDLPLSVEGTAPTFRETYVAADASSLSLKTGSAPAPFRQSANCAGTDTISRSGRLRTETRVAAAPGFSRDPKRGDGTDTPFPSGGGAMHEVTRSVTVRPEIGRRVLSLRVSSVTGNCGPLSSVPADQCSVKRDSVADARSATWSAMRPGPVRERRSAIMTRHTDYKIRARMEKREPDRTVKTPTAQDESGEIDLWFDKTGAIRIRESFGARTWDGADLPGLLASVLESTTSRLGKVESFVRLAWAVDSKREGEEGTAWPEDLELILGRAWNDVWGVRRDLNAVALVLREGHHEPPAIEEPDPGPVTAEGFAELGASLIEINGSAARKIFAALKDAHRLSSAALRKDVESRRNLAEGLKLSDGALAESEEKLSKAEAITCAEVAG